MAVSTETTAEKWPYIVVGVLSIIFGLVAIIWPHLTLGVLLFFFAVYVLLAGVLLFIDMVLRMGQDETWWPSAVLGLICIGAGLFVLVNPTVSATLLLWVIAFWAVFIGIVEVIGSLLDGDLLMLIVGILTVGFGFVLIANPTAGALALVLVIGVFSIVRGILLLAGAVQPPTTPTIPA
jgi:uncharacterized membrane protein HdeD (DUF308 family)